MNREELQRQCEAFSNEELLIIFNNKGRYTAEQVKAVLIEIKRRAITKEELGKYKEKRRKGNLIIGNIVDEIGIIDKVLFFFFWLPQFSFMVVRKFRRENHTLKIRQATYYFIAGAVCCLLAIALPIKHISLITGLIIWVLSYFPVYLFDKFYFTPGLMRRLAVKLAKQEEAAD
jgi:fatty acid desaturase